MSMWARAERRGKPAAAAESRHLMAAAYILDALDAVSLAVGGLAEEEDLDLFLVGTFSTFSTFSSLEIRTRNLRPPLVLRRHDGLESARAGARSGRDVV